MKNAKLKYVYNQPEYGKSICSNIQLLRVILEKDFTKIDLGYQATGYYIRGGWARISKDTFIRIKQTGKNLKITGADNIPIGGTKQKFKSTKDWLYFSLYFPPITPKGNLSFDLIEKEPTEGTDFNFYDIELKLQEAIRLL